MKYQNNFATHKVLWFTRTILGLMKGNGRSEHFVLPMKRNNDLEQFCCSKNVMVVNRNFLANYEK